MKTIKTLLLGAALAVQNKQRLTAWLICVSMGATALTSSAAIQFNGTSSYAVLNASYLNGITNTTFTFDFWIKPNVVNTYQGLWGKTESGGNSWFLQIYGDGRLAFNTWWPGHNEEMSSPTNTITANKWQHVTIVGDGTAFQFYLDGFAIPTAGAHFGQLSFRATTVGTQVGPMSWGFRDNYSGSDDGWFNGSLSDYRVWDKALSASEVAANHRTPPSNAAQGLRHYFPLNESSGTTFTDIIGGLQGQLFNTTWGPGPLPRVDLIKAVKPSFSYLAIGTNYQLQVSGDMNTWTNHASPFTATNTSMVYPEYWDVENWGKLFFRLQSVP